MLVKQVICLADSLLAGDMSIPEDDCSRFALLNYAYEMIGLNAYVVDWRSTVSDGNSIRTYIEVDEMNNEVIYYINRPLYHESMNDDCKVPNGQLVFALARFLASFIVKDMQLKAYHYERAIELCKSYQTNIGA